MIVASTLLLAAVASPNPSAAARLVEGLRVLGPLPARTCVAGPEELVRALADQGVRLGAVPDLGAAAAQGCGALLELTDSPRVASLRLVPLDARRWLGERAPSAQVVVLTATVAAATSTASVPLGGELALALGGGPRRSPFGDPLDRVLAALTLEGVDALATIEPSVDGAQLLFHVAPGRVDHAGRPVDAAALAGAMVRTCAPGSGQRFLCLLGKATLVDPGTVSLALEPRVSATGAIELLRSPLARLRFADGPAWVGTGRLRLERGPAASGATVLVPVLDHPSGRAPPDRVVLSSGRDGQARPFLDEVWFLRVGRELGSLRSADGLGGLDSMRRSQLAERLGAQARPRSHLLTSDDRTGAPTAPIAPLRVELRIPDDLPAEPRLVERLQLELHALGVSATAVPTPRAKLAQLEARALVLDRALLPRPRSPLRALEELLVLAERLGLEPGRLLSGGALSRFAEQGGETQRLQLARFERAIELALGLVVLASRPHALGVPARWEDVVVGEDGTLDASHAHLPALPEPAESCP